MDQLKDENKTLKDEIKTLKDDNEDLCRSALRWEYIAHNYEDWEDKYGHVCGVYSIDDQDDDYRQEILDAIKTLKDENTKLKIIMKRISLLVAEQELDALKQ